jgi:chitinase
MIMKPYLFRSLIFLLCVPLLIGCAAPQENRSTETENRMLIAYVAGWGNFDLASIDHSKLTHINYAFANINEGKAVMELEEDSANMATLVSFRETNHDLKILLSVGGWVWSNWFSDAALTESSRKIFANSIVELIKRHDLDGVDLDWEYPGQRAEDNAYRPIDKDNFTLMLKEIREKLDKLGIETGDRHYLLTIASGSDQAYFDHTNLGAAQRYLDFINVMTYDFYNGWMFQTGHHANLFPSENENFGGNSAVETIERHLTAGVPVEKLVLGFPFYGRMWEGVHTAATGLYQYAGTGGTFIPYNKIYGLDANSWESYWDQSAAAPYLWNPESGVFISYENPKSIGLKVDYIKEHGLSGAMFWEYSNDHKQQLLDELYTQLNADK